MCVGYTHLGGVQAAFTNEYARPRSPYGRLGGEPAPLSGRSARLSGEYGGQHVTDDSHDQAGEGVYTIVKTAIHGACGEAGGE
jgi:hypothetical protein